MIRQHLEVPTELNVGQGSAGDNCGSFVAPRGTHRPALADSSLPIDPDALR